MFSTVDIYEFHQEDDYLGLRGPLLVKNSLTAGSFIPIEIARLSQLAAIFRASVVLPTCPGPADEDHFIFQVFPDGVLQIAGLEWVHNTLDR